MCSAAPAAVAARRTGYGCGLRDHDPPRGDPSGRGRSRGGLNANGPNTLPARISHFVFLGGAIELGLTLEGGERLAVVASPAAVRDAGIELRADAGVTLTISPADIIAM
ncbi:TOBE domain-containing protein [Paracoccus cavernae]|uniref:TOBE domain-containing protein n=1 Tax=Paracoccus cavernae TaxID=1571207 RepID=A0ABT8DB13_9RHOB|nr:TOBE domain-containing protein [Paracoccus cavernae]